MVLQLLSILMLIPWTLLMWGAIRRLRYRNTRLRRLQLEGASMLFTGALARWIIDTFWQTPAWYIWFVRAENGLFWIGCLFFGLGFFLMRRPRPEQLPWPNTGKRVGITSILLGGAVGILVNMLRETAPHIVSWDMGRVFFTLGIYPFAIVYLRWHEYDAAPAEEDLS